MIPGIGIGGGAERSLLDLAPGLREQGIELTVLYFHERPTSAAAAFAEAGATTVHLDRRHLPGRVRGVRAEIRRRRPDVVHTTLYEADVVGRTAALGLPPKVCTSLVSTPYAPARRLDPGVSAWRVNAVRAVDAATLRLRCDRVHANSEAVKASAVARLGVRPDDVAVIPRGRDPEALPIVDAAGCRRARARLGLDPERPILLVVGREEPTKEHRTLLSALPAILDRHRDALLLVAGREGAATPDLDAAVAELDLGGAVRRLGYRADVADLLAAADVFAFPSVLEGLPGAVIEAMATGLPIVAADIAPVRELVGDDEARLVPPRDPAAMAAAVIDVLDEPDAARRRAEAARRRFEERYTLDRVLAQTVAFYRDLVAS